MSMDLVTVLKWVKSLLYKIHLLCLSCSKISDLFNQVNDHICASSGCDEYFTFDDRNFEAKLGTGID